ncbi:MAG: ATP-binding protein [Nanoarchaeota archaeon]
MVDTLRKIIERQYQTYLEIKSQFYIKRRARFIDTPLIQVVIGPRRAGKSFFCIHEAPPSVYLNFDDEGLLKYSIEEILAMARIIFPQYNHIILDEIQNLNNWQLIVNRLHRQGQRIIITGSNAHLLSGELATHLTGRHIPIFILPLSYQEAHQALNTSFQEYIATGGLPENILRPEQTLPYTTTLVQSILLKDIVQRYRIRKVAETESLLQSMLSNSAQIYSDRKLAHATDVKSPTSIRKYIRYFESAFLLFTIPSFSYKTTSDITLLKKAFAYDAAYIQALSQSKNPDEGRLYETIVAIQLKHEELLSRHRLYFYKNAQGYEVDFVLVKEKKATALIQVTANPNLEREVRGLIHAAKDTRCDNLIIVQPQETHTKKETWFGTTYTIHCISFEEWLLNGGR